MTANAALAGAARSERFGDTEVTTRAATISPTVPNAQAPDQIEVFRERCEARALLFVNGLLSLHDAIDELQNAAVGRGLVDRIGQDAVQAIMGAAFAAVRLPAVPEPNEPMASGRSYRIPRSTVDTFWFLVGCNDADRLKAWLRQHAADAPTLLKHLEAR